MTVRDSRLITLDVLEKSVLLCIRQPRSRHGTVRYAEIGDDTDNACDDTEDDKHDAPTREGGALHVLKAEGCESTYDLANAQTRVLRMSATIV